MKINLFGYNLIVELQKSDIVARVEALAKTYIGYGDSSLATKIARVKAYRNLTNAMLKESKDWVESHFA